MCAFFGGGGVPARRKKRTGPSAKTDWAKQGVMPACGRRGGVGWGGMVRPCGWVGGCVDSWGRDGVDPIAPSVVAINRLSISHVLMHPPTCLNEFTQHVATYPGVHWPRSPPRRTTPTACRRRLQHSLLPWGYWLQGLALHKKQGGRERGLRPFPFPACAC